MQFHVELSVSQKMLHRHTCPHQALHRADALEAYRSQLKARTARQRFHQLYRLRNLLFRLVPRLASRMAL